MKGVLNIIIREIKYILQSRLYVLAMFAFPVIDCVFLGGIYISGNLTEIPVAVIDNDNSKISRTIVRYIDATPDMEVKYRLQNINELKDLFFRQKAVLGVYIPKNLQKDIKRQKQETVTLFVNSSNYITGNITDLTSQTIIATIGGGIKYSSLTKKGVPPKQAMQLLQPVKNDGARLFNPALNYNLYLTPGLWLSVLHQMLILVGVLTIGTEFDFKKIKTMTAAANGSLANAFLGKMIVYMSAAYIHFEVLYRIIFPAFDIPIAHSASAAMALSMCFAFSAISLGFLLSAALKTRLDALKGCLLISAPAFMMSGYTWPLDQVPAPLKLIVQIIPLTPFLEGFRKIYQQDLGIAFVFPFALHLIIMGMVYFSVSYAAVYLWNKKNEN
ncbi:MAG: ABC transporter permease [Endomicrobium sp.]|jgi:ABC-2 type transport system permease protein|nr:ABC transporter permease [Endomicrobium sp.]